MNCDQVIRMVWKEGSVEGLLKNMRGLCGGRIVLCLDNAKGLPNACGKKWN